MSMDQPSPHLLSLLAHDVRWRLLKMLTVSDYRVQELAAFVDQPMNLVSYHLKKLRDDHVVTIRRSEADARDVYYSLDVDSLRQFYRDAGLALHPALGSELPLAPAVPVLSGSLRVLFVCTHNSARSQMAEGLLRSLTGGLVEVSSAGSHPTALHSDAISTMDALGIDIRGQQSKPLRDFEQQHFDYVITVCDRAREICPVFPGGQQLHWGFSDPTVIADARERQLTFAQIARQLQSRLFYFLTLIAQRPSRQKADHDS